MSVDIEKLSAKTSSVIENMCSEERAAKLVDLLEKIGLEKYFTAPASSKEQFHNCFPGGLAQHNLNVVNSLIELDAIVDGGFDPETLCVVGILHDIGKVVNTDLVEFYSLETERWKIERGEIYSKNDGKVYLPTHQRTMWLITHFGFELSIEEYQAILLNDGQYLAENKAYANKECVLADLLHMADKISLIKEKAAETKDKS